MVRGRAQGRDQPEANPNQEFMTILMNIQRRLDEQADLILNLQQQQQGRVVEPVHEEPGNDDVGMGHVDGGNEHGGNDDEDPPLGAPGGVELGIRRDPRLQPERREYLCERLCKMKPPLFEGSINPLDAEEWLSTMETILDFMELRDDEKIICAAYVLRKEARYWWDAVKTRRNIREMMWTDFVYEFNKKFFNPTTLSAQQT